jgi:hypothetical protein
VDLGALPPRVQAVAAGREVLDLSEAQAVEWCAALLEAGGRPCAVGARAALGAPAGPHGRAGKSTCKAASDAVMDGGAVALMGNRLVVQLAPLRLPPAARRLTP